MQPDMRPDVPCEHHGSRVGLFSLNGTFKAGCSAGLITANHTWGAEWSCASALSFSSLECSPVCGPSVGVRLQGGLVLPRPRGGAKWLGNDGPGRAYGIQLEAIVVQVVEEGDREAREGRDVHGQAWMGLPLRAWPSGIPTARLTRPAQPCGR